MLETLLARYLGKFLKDFTAEHISAHLLKGSVKLKDVELDLTTLEQEFFAKVPKPAALELQSVRCASIGLKVPWKRLRRKPVIFELSGLEVKVSVHSPENVEGKVQEKLNRHVDSQEEMNIEEAEDVEDGKVESQLKVGLKEVILDGLQIMLNTLQVDLAAQDGETAASRPLLRLSLEALETFPCSVRGEKINRPQDVYEFCDPCARLFRSVQIDGLKLITLDHQPGALVEVIGQVGIQLEQRRWCGFIPHHRARRVCPFSSETAIALRVPSVAMQLQVEPIMAVCEVLLHLIKGGMTYSELNESDSSPTAEVESAITWSTPQAGGAGAAGLDFQEQLLSRKKLNILTFTLTLLQCGATLCLGHNAAQLEAFDFVFTMDIISSLDSFRWRCLSELGLHEGVPEGMTLKAVCLQRRFGLELGKATLLWSSLGSEDRPITLIALGEDHRTGTTPSVTFRWKDIPPERPCDESLQPMEGCFLSVKLCVVIEAFQRLVDMVTTVVMPFVELLEPPPFAVGWCRIRMHDLTIEIPEVPLAKALPMKFSIPSLLLSSLEGLGHLFTCLDTLPSRHGYTQHSAAYLQGEEVAETARMRRLCACGRELGGFLRLGNGFTPLRGAVNWTTAWQIRQTKSGDHVLVGYDEFLDLVKHQVTSRALDSLLLSFETKPGKDAMPKSGDDVPQLEISASSRRSRSSRSWLSGFKRSEKSGKSGSVARKATDVAKEWATLQEAVLRLQRQREELKLKKDALRQAADEAKQESKNQATQVEDDLALQIAVQRGKQAELSAQAEEQKQLIAQLLQRRQQNALRF